MSVIVCVCVFNSQISLLPQLAGNKLETLKGIKSWSNLEVRKQKIILLFFFLFLFLLLSTNRFLFVIFFFIQNLSLSLFFFPSIGTRGELESHRNAG